MVNQHTSERFWDEGRERQAAQLYAEGYSCGQIASQMGCSRNAVIGKIHRLGLSRSQSEAQSIRRASDRFKDRQPISRAPKRKAPPKAADPKARLFLPKSHLRHNPEPTGSFPPTQPKSPLDFTSMRSVPLICEPVTFRERKANQCAWILGAIMDPATADSMVCGAEVMAGRSFCPGHQGLALSVRNSDQYRRMTPTPKMRRGTAPAERVEAEDVADLTQMFGEPA